MCLNIAQTIQLQIQKFEANVSAVLSYRSTLFTSIQPQACTMTINKNKAFTQFITIVMTAKWNRRCSVALIF